MTPEQIGFVQQQLAAGMTPEQIEHLLLTNGYTSDQVAELFRLAALPQGMSVAMPQGLPPLGLFIQNVKNRLKGRLLLVVVMIAYSLIVSTVLAIHTDSLSATGLVLLVVAILSIPLSIAVSFMALRNMLGDASRPLLEDFLWAIRNVGSLFWVGLLNGLVVFAGFILFIIPGMILGGYLGLTQIVRTAEGVRGINAMIRSTELVRGNWWGSFWRIAVVVVPVAFICGFSSGIVGVFVGKTTLVGRAVATIAQSIAGIVFLAAAIEVYYSLASGQPAFDPARPTSLRTLYRILAWLSPFLIIGAVLLMVLLLSAMFFTHSKMF